MRSVLSIRWLVSVAATIAIALIGTAALAPSPSRSGPGAVVATTRPAVPPSLALTRAVDRTVAERSARVSGTATSDDGVIVDLEGSTSFTGPDAVLLARPAGQGEADPIEVRTTTEGTWIRSPSSPSWISLPTSAPPTRAGSGWAETLERLRRAGDVRTTGRVGRGTSMTATMDGRPVSVVLDIDGRIHGLRLERGRDTVEVTFSDFGVAVEVRPPPDL